MAFLFSTCRTNFDQRTNRNFMVVPIPQHSLSIASNDYLQLRGAADFHAKGETRFRPERRKGKIEEGDKIPHLSSARGKSSILARSSTLCSVTKERRRRENARGKEKGKGREVLPAKETATIPYSSNAVGKTREKFASDTLVRPSCLCTYARPSLYPCSRRSFSPWRRRIRPSFQFLSPFIGFSIHASRSSLLSSFETKRRKNDITPRKYRRRCAY